MNYRHQFKGLDVDCDRLPDGADRLGYSNGSRIALVQGQLSEPAGVCPAGHPLHRPVDWNGNGVIDPAPVSYPGPFSTTAGCGDLAVSTDHDDYAALKLPPSTPTDGGAPVPADDSGACPATNEE